MNRNDIIKRKFSHAFFGYDVEDVDLFLDEVIREMDRIHNELDIETLKADAARQREEKLRFRLELMSQLLADAGVSVSEEFFLEAEAANSAQKREEEAAFIEREEEEIAAESEPEAQSESEVQSESEAENESADGQEQE